MHLIVYMKILLGKGSGAEFQRAILNGYFTNPFLNICIIFRQVISSYAVCEILYTLISFNLQKKNIVLVFERKYLDTVNMAL